MIRVNAISILNYLVSGALTILIPLLLLDRNMSVAEIGVILSVLPLVFLTARLIFAAIADYVGWSRVYLYINWPSAVGSVIIYYFANSTPIFLAGKIGEGLRESSYWAVIRTSIYQLAPLNAGKEASKNNAFIWIATAAGGAIAGLSIAYVGFSISLVLLAIVSMAIGIPAIMLRKTSVQVKKARIREMLAPIDPRGRTGLFWTASISLMFASLTVYPLVTLLLPVYMNQQLNYDYVSIGFIFLLYNAVSAVGTYFSLKRPLGLQRAVMLSFISIVASVFLVFSNIAFALAIVALAFVRGYGIGFFEYTIIKVMKNPENICVDIGLIHVPQRIAEFVSTLSAGFLAQAFGYAPIFIAIGAFFAPYALIALFVIKSKT